MTKQSQDKTPSLVAERLKLWGASIRALRLTQNIRVADLCARMGITHTTLLRVEKGDPAAGAGLYMSALLMLGALDILAPVPPQALLNSGGTRHRVRLPAAAGADDDF